jgi:hypothetical protein
MRYELIVTEDAEIDIEQAMDWYESQQKGLGIKYILSVRACLKLILKNPFVFAIIYLKIRKANTKKFPYSLYYTINELNNEIITFAVIHGHRSDKIWKQRIDNNQKEIE